MTEEPQAEPDEVDDPWKDAAEEASDDFGAPQVLAVVAFVLAVISMLGLGLMNGAVYTAPFLSMQPGRGELVLGPLLGAALALVPVVLGWRASSRVLDEDAAWIAPLARAAVLLGLMGLLLRLVVAVIQATQADPSGFTRL